MFIMGSLSAPSSGNKQEFCFGEFRLFGGCIHSSLAFKGIMEVGKHLDSELRVSQTMRQIQLLYL